MIFNSPNDFGSGHTSSPGGEIFVVLIYFGFQMRIEQFLLMERSLPTAWSHGEWIRLRYEAEVEVVVCSGLATTPRLKPYPSSLGGESSYFVFNLNYKIALKLRLPGFY
jgi:hypothetical protein